jgi:arginine decarboxylase
VHAICQLAHSRNIPLLVDEAHGSHLKFHEKLPISAVAIGADIIVHSIHKTQVALTQASMLHVNSNGLIDLSRVAQVLSLLQTSSPSSILLASLDAARSQMATEGHALLTKILELARIARESISEIKGLWCYGKDLIGCGGVSAFDPTKLIIRVSDTGYSGFEAFKILQQQYGIDAEFSDLKHVICSITIADNQTTVDRLIDALMFFSDNVRQTLSIDTLSIKPPQGLPTMVSSPRDAFFAFKARTVSIDEAINRTLIETIIPYPPGVPLLVSGEKIEQRHVDYIRYLVGKGSDFIGVDDPSLETVRVMCD